MNDSKSTIPTFEGGKTLLASAFTGIALILMVALVIALYTQDRLSSAVQRTTAEALPELLAALRLSERNALLAATTPTLVTTKDYSELAATGVRLDQLLADVDRQLGQSATQAGESQIKQMRDAVQVQIMRTTLEKLKAANIERIKLETRQTEALLSIQKVHSELIDTVSPVVYGVSSLNKLFARRDQRKQRGMVRELTHDLYPTVQSLLALESLSGKTPLTDETRDELQNHLLELKALITTEDFMSLSNATNSYLDTNAPVGLRMQTYHEHLASQLEQAFAELERGLEELAEQGLPAMSSLVAATTRDLSVAIDIKAEGNLMLALLRAVADVSQPDALAALEVRFKNSLATFKAAALAFQISPLAKRNPVLAGNVQSIAQQVAGLASNNDPFTLRRQLLNLHESIEELLAIHREVARDLTERTQQLVSTRENDTTNLAEQMDATRRISQWVLSAASVGGLMLMALIAVTTVRMLENRERQLQSAREATLSANRMLEAVGYSARRLLASEFWEQAVDDVIARIGDAMDASHVTLYRNLRGTGRHWQAQLMRQWQSQESPQANRNAMPDVIRFPQRALTRSVDSLERGEILYGVVGDFCAKEREILEHFGIRSVLIAPIRFNEEFWGCICVADCDRERDWRVQDRETLVAAADNLGTAIARDRIAEDLRKAAIVFDSTQEGLLITDAGGTIVAANPAFTRMSGYTVEELIGENPRMFKGGRQAAGLAEEMWSSLEANGNWQGEVCNRSKDNTIYTEWLTINSVRDQAGKLSHYVGVYSDVAAIKESQARMYHLAHHDPLTNLPNRLLLADRLGHAIERARREGLRVAVLFLDLDRFKNINDTLGHSIGDEVLQQIGKRLEDNMRAEDTVARLGGDEFMIIIDHLRHPEEAGVIAHKALELITEEMCIDDLTFYLTGSIGISLYPDDGNSVDDLIKNADTAMYRAKESGRNKYHFYTSELTAHAEEHFVLENNLRVALERGEFELHYQPQRDLATGALIGLEALLRWRHPKHGLIGPDRFIPVAEDAGLMLGIGTWVLRTACCQARQWVDAGLSSCRVAVNLSAKQIVRDDLPETVAQILAECDLDPKHLELEITESFVMQQPEHTISTLDRIRAMGVSLAVDDFGVGHSSLGQLKRLPCHLLKIDRSFVRDMPSDPHDQSIGRAIVAMGHALGLRVIAEGIENSRQADVLQDTGCDAGQGYLFGRPLPASEILALLLSETGQRSTDASSS